MIGIVASPLVVSFIVGRRGREDSARRGGRSTALDPRRRTDYDEDAGIGESRIEE
jgi:hypothetical protein